MDKALEQYLNTVDRKLRPLPQLLLRRSVRLSLSVHA